MMLRTSSRGLITAILMALLTSPLLSGGFVAKADDAPTSPTTQPAGEDEDPLVKLQRIKEQMERERGIEPERRPSMAELRRRAMASTQRAEGAESDPADVDASADAEQIGPPAHLAEPASETPSKANERSVREPQVTRSPRQSAPLERRARKTDNTEWFNFTNTPWEDVIAHFVERIGKPLMGGDTMMPVGTLTYVAERKFTKEEAIDELNLIMYEQDYRFVEQEHHVRLIPLADMPTWVPVSDTYSTMSEFEEANPRSMDYVIVYYRVKDQPAQELVDAFGGALGIHTLLTAMEESNQIKLTGLARDVRKFKALIDKIDISPGDPRELRIFDIKTNARDIEQMVREFLQIGGGSRIQMVRDPRTRRMVPKRVAAGKESTVQMVADERTNSIIVKATKDEMSEIEQLIEQFDQKPDIGEFKTKVIEIKHAEATEVANLLSQILQQEQGEQTRQTSRQLRQRLQRAARARRSRGRGARQPQVQQPTGVSPEDILQEGIFERAKKTIRLVADSRTNSLIVYANEEGFKRVEEMLEIIDKPLPDNYQVVELEHAEIGQIAPLVQQIVQGMADTSMRPGRAPTIVPDEATNSFHLLGEPEEMERVISLITKLDVPGAEQERHIVELKNLRPSQVAQMVQSLVGGSGGASSSLRSTVRRRGMRGRRGVSPTVTTGRSAGVETIPLDEAQILIVICADEDWEKVEGTISLWDDRALTNTPKLETFTIEKGDADSIAGKLQMFYRSYQHPAFGRSSVGIQAEGDKILVYGIRPAIEEIGALIESLDIESAEDKVEMLPLGYADANQVAQLLQSQFGQSRRGRRGGSTGPMIQAEPVTNSLIVKADKKDLEAIREFAAEMDEKVAAQEPERKFVTLRYADPREVASAVQQVYGGAAGGRRSRFGGTPVGTSVKCIALPRQSQVMVEAPQEKLAEIGSFVTELDDPKGKEIVIKTIKIEGADVTQIARKLSTAFRQKRNVTAIFDADPTSETILLTCNKDALEDAEALIAEYHEAAQGQAPIVEFRQMQYASAADAARWLREQLITYMQPQLGRRASQQIRVTADSRTNRVVINAPNVAVEYGKQLLDQFDIEMTKAPETPMFTEARKLPGLEVRSLAGNLDRVFRSRPRRPDGLRPSFSYDMTTETLIISAPKDMQGEINELINVFAKETEGLEIEQKFFPVQEADANYIAGQLRNVLINHLRQTRGRGVADRVAISVDTRLNRLVIQAPQIVMPIAEDLIAKLDQKSTTESQLQTIALENADANAVYQVLRQIFNEKIRARTLQISAEPMTNSLIVGGSSEDFEDIEKWAKELDEQAMVKKGRLEVVDIMNASPLEVRNILSAQYGGGGRGRRQKLGEEFRFDVIGGRSLVVQAPEDKMPDVLALIEQLDSSDVEKVEVRVYELPGIGRDIRTLAREVTRAMNQTIEQRERRVAITPYEKADTLIVTARTDQFTEIENFIDKFRPLIEKETTVTRFIELKYLDAQRYARQIQDMLANKLAKEGRRSSRHMQNLSITPDPRTNRLICYVPEKIVTDLEEVIEFLDVEPTVKQGELRTIELAYADANTVANILRPMFEQRSRSRSQQDFSQVEVKIQPEPITNSLIVHASDEDFAQIQKKAQEIDEGAIVRKSDPVLIELQYADPWQIVNVINNAFRESGKKWGTRMNESHEVSVQVVGTRLLVQAPKEKLEDVKKLVTDLDVADTGGVVLKTYILPGMGWELNNLASQIQRIVQTLDPPTRSQRNRSYISAYPQADTLIAAVPADQLDKVEELIGKFTQDVGDRTPLTRFYELEYARANEIIGTLQQVLQNMVGRSRGRQAQQQLSITADNRTNRIVVTAPETLQAEVAGVVKSMDVPPEMIEGELQSVSLENADASMVANTLRPLFQEKARQKRADKSYVPVTITPETITNTLLVYGGDETDQQLIDREIARIDKEVVDAELRPVTLTLEYADANQTAQLINSMYGARRGHGRSEQQSVQATVSNGLLVVKAPKKKLDEIRALVTEIDTPDPGGVQVKTYDLKILNATQVQMAVQPFLRTIKGSVKAGQLQPGAFAEPTTNTLVVMAPPETLPFIDKLISELEGKAPKSGQAHSYVLKNVRAEQIAQNVQTMLQAKVVEREGARRSSVQTAVFPDPASNRLFVYAPEDYQQLANELINMLDKDVDTGEIVHIIPLTDGDAVQMAQSLQSIVQGGSRGRRGATTDTLRISADAGSNSVLIAGLPQDVAKAEEWLRELEINSVTVPELQIFTIDNASVITVQETLNSIFGSGRGQDAVWVTTDDYSNKIYVTANKRTMRQVEQYVSELDRVPDPNDTELLAGGRQIYFVDVNRGSPSNIAWDVRDALPDYGMNGPSIEADWFDEYLIVKCRPAEFPRIERLVREFEKRARTEIVVKQFKPKGDPEALLQYLQARSEGENVTIDRAPRRGGIESKVEELWPEGTLPPSLREPADEPDRESTPSRPPARKGRTSDARSRETLHSGAVLTSARLLDDIENELYGAQPAYVARDHRTVTRADRDSVVFRPAAYFPQADDAPATGDDTSTKEPARDADDTTSTASGGVTETVPSPLEKQKTRIVVQPDGTFLLHGPEDDVQDIVDVFEVLQEDMAAGEVIRIFKFRYGDVSAAAQVLSIMFDVQQQRRVIIQQPQRGRQGRQDDEGGRGQQGMMDQLRGMVGGRSDRQDSKTALRIATDPSHNYLIIKCDAVDLPEIRQLLRELDIPPGEVNIRVFQLENLDAEETAANIKDALGISKVQERRRPTQRGGRGRGQQQIIDLFEQQQFSIGGVEGGAKVEQVEIVPNAATNSLMISAPPEVMKLIESVIEKLEGLEGRNIVGIHHYALERAKAEDILPLLQEIFTATAGGGGAPMRGRRGGGGAPGAMGAVSISADPRTDTIIFVCENKDVEKVESQIASLDLEVPLAEAEMYVCQYGDADAIAAVVDTIYGTGATTGRGGGRGARSAQPTSAGLEVRIVSEPATNTILVWGPPDKRMLILSKVEELDRLNQRDIREIAIQYADPEELAETLSQIFAGQPSATGGGRGRGRGARGGGPSVVNMGRIMIVGDKDAQKLLVRAPDETFAQLEQLVAVLDQPSEQLKLRTFSLRYADATAMVESVKTAMAEYMSLASKTGNDTDFDAFTAVPDPRTNSITVVGSEETFLFVQEIVNAFDVQTPEDQKKEFRIFILEKADAVTVADAINGFATGGEGMTGGRGRGRGGAAAGGLREINVTAVPDETTNSVMVFGRMEDIALVEEMVINQVEDSISDRIQIAEVEVKNVPASQIVGFIWEFIDQSDQAGGSGGGRGRGGQRGTLSDQGGPQIVPNDNGNKIIVRGTKRQVEEVRNLVRRFDDPDIIAQTIKVIQVPTGRDVFALASEVERLVNDSETEAAEASGRRPRQITVGADAYTNTLIVAGEPALFGRAEMIITQLKEVRAENAVTRVIQLRNLSAQDAVEAINELQQESRSGANRVRRSGGSSRSTPSRGGSRGRRRGALPMLRVPALDGHIPGADEPALTRPYLGLTVLNPVLGLYFADAAAQPTPQDRPSGGATDVSEMLSGVSGTLRGEVQVQALDSQQIIITGDQDDVDFIEQILAMMELSKSPAIIEVFDLTHAKATALAPIIETTIQSHIVVQGGEEEFSINAEGRSNSLIVSASEEMMGRIATLVQTLDVEDAGGGVQSKSVVLENMRASEAVGILKPIVEDLNTKREVPKEAQASITAVQRNNSIMIVGTPADLEEIEKLIRNVDVALDPESDDGPTSFTTADVILVPLKNAIAEDVATVLTEMIEEQQEAARQAEGDKPGEPFVKVLRLRLEDGRELPSLNLDRPIKVIPEPGTNSLIIFSSAENNEALTEIVGVFDTLPIGADTDVKAFALKYGNAEEVAELIQEIFDKKRYLKRPAEGDDDNLEKGTLPPVPPGVAAQGLPYPLLVQHDARTNTVFVVGRSDAVILAGGLIQELDRPTVALGMQAYVLQLKRVSVEELAEKLDTLLEERAQALGADQNEARDSAVIQPDARTNSLIVFATDEVYGMIEDLVTQLDTAEKYGVVDMRYRPLKYADAVKIQEILTEMFEAKAEAEQDTNQEANDSLMVLADTRSNSLLMTGTRDYLDEAESLISQLDQKFDGTVEFRALKLKLNSAPNVAALLTDMIDKALKQSDSNLTGSEIHVAADPLSDSLLIVAAREDLDLVERWVQILDRPSEVGRMTRIIPLRRGVAEEVSSAAQDIFKLEGQSGEVDVTITHDAKTNSVVAFGPPSLLADIEEFVRGMDEVEPGGQAVVRMFKLEQADAEIAQELLQRILEGEGGSVGGQGGGGGNARQEAANQVMLIYQDEVGKETLRAMRSDIVVIADVRTNSLVVTAPPESMALMESMVTAVDVPPDAARIRVFQLVNADAEQMVETLKELFERQDTMGAAGDDESERVLSLGALGEGGREEVSFTTDVRTNSVIAAGTPGYLDLVEKFIFELDTIPIQDRETFVYSPKYIPADALAPSITEFSDAERQRLEDIGDDISTAVLQQREVTAIANEDSNRMIVAVDPRYRSTVMRVIDDLDRPAPQVLIQVLILEVSMDNELDLGVEFAFQDLQYSKAGPTDTTTFDYVGGTDLGAAGSGLGGFTFTITGADFNFLFRTLQNEGSLKVLSRPQIVAMDNKEAVINISDDVPYVSGTQTSTTGQISTSVSRKNVGIVLTVTPQINLDGFVRMHIKQEVSDITGSTIDVGQGVTSPIFFERVAETDLMVRDNETVVLGGLIQTREEDREQKIPIVGDLPGLGMLFRNQNETMSRTELLVVLTPHVIHTPKDYRELSTREYENLSGILDDSRYHRLTVGMEEQLNALRKGEPQAADETPAETAAPAPTPMEPAPTDEPAGPEKYGPMQPAMHPDRRARPVDPDSYDVPLSLLERRAS